MCYNFRTSIIAYTLGISSAIFAFATRQIVLGMLILFYAQMQLSEAMIWRGIDTDDTDLNKKGTTYGKYLLATHNIGIGIGIILAILFVNRSKISPKQFIPLLAGILFFAYVVIFEYLPKKYADVTFPHDRVCEKNCQSPENRLKWPYPHRWYLASYLISLVIMLLWVKPMSSKILFVIFFSVTFGLTAFVNPNTVGSVWCFSTSFLAPLVLVINYFLTRNTSSSNMLT